jgi:transposase-like protein
MKKKQPRAYSTEFRGDALRQLQSGTKPIRHLAPELGIHIETLRNWRRDARVAPMQSRARRGAEPCWPTVPPELLRRPETRLRRRFPSSRTAMMASERTKVRIVDCRLELGESALLRVKYYGRNTAPQGVQPIVAVRRNHYGVARRAASCGHPSPPSDQPRQKRCVSGFASG